jgi:hypothetical protein
MRKALSIVLVLALGLSASAWAKPADVSKSLDKFKYLELNSGKTSDYMGTVTGGVLNSSALAGTCWYGGTTWDVTDMRWEANVNDEWTFDTGNGSFIIGAGQTGADYAAVTGSATPNVNKFKQEGLHALMEGWVGFDNSFSELTYLRLLSSADAGWAGNPLVGTAHYLHPGLLSGTHSWYCGVFKGEADLLCYSAGGGYGNSWRLCMGKNVNTTGGAVTLAFNMVWSSESDYDFTTVEVDTAGSGLGSDVVVAAAYDGTGFGAQSLTLSPNLEVRGTAGPMQVRFCFTADGAWSDEDGLNPTSQGAFSIDDVGMSGGVNDGPYNFDDAAGHGWARLEAAEGAGGEWARLALIDDLPPYLTPCTCDIADSVLVFEDLTAGGHNGVQDNLAASPWIELQSGGDGPGKFIQTNIYAELPLLNYVFVQFNTQYYPLKCTKTGLDLVSSWTSDGFIYYFGGVPQCTTPNSVPTRIDFGSKIDPGATDIRIAIGVISLCAGQSDCSEVSNHTPLFDQVSLGVFGQGGAPLINTTTVDLPQDNFPTNGLLRLDAPVRFDAGNVANESSPEVNSIIGDTLIVDGAQGSAAVFVDFAVTPGPFINNTDLAAFYSRVSMDGTANGRTFYTARMDTAELGGAGATSGTWMTAYHEEDSHFIGADDGATDPNDLGPYPTSGRLLNDIFPDDLFTPGTRVEIFYRTATLDTNGVPTAPWFVLPDTGLVAGGNYIEWEALPSSASSDTSWNCVLYIDHFDGRGAQGYIENGLGTVLGFGGNNFEGTNWDRYDVRAPSSQQVSFGRPLGSEYGASVIQTLGYDCIVWNSGNLNAFNLVKEDADVLIPYLTLLDFPGNTLYVSGDGAANSMTGESATEPSALLLLNTVMGAKRRTGCNTFRDANCPNGGDPQDTTACVAVDPVGGLGPAANQLVRSGSHYAQGNGCPQQRSFDVLDQFNPINGSSAGDELYDSGVKTANYASVAADSPGGVGVPLYRTLIDGMSVHYRRDTDAPCAFAAPGGFSVTAVEERVAEALNYLGHSSASECTDPTASTAVEPRQLGPAYRTTLANFAPNPLLAGAKGKITFTMAKDGPANIDIFDVNGRLVKTVFDGIAQAGPNEAAWNGTDFTGRDVASGVYFYRLRADQKDLSKKMVVVRNGGN